MASRIVVVGAGHNGLTAAAYLARAGHNVLVLERREIVGGCAVTEEVDPVAAPGCRVSTASYIASMLTQRVIDDLRLASYGLRMVACEPGVQAAFEDGDVVAQWSDTAKMRGELQRVAPADVEPYFATDEELKRLAAWLQPFFLEPPPNPDARGLDRLAEALRVGRRVHGMRGRDVTGLIAFLTGSLGEFLDARFESDKLKRLILANSLYGKRGGPYQPGSAMGLLFHLLTGGEEARQGFQGHVIGGMGAISGALAGACRDLGVEIRTTAAVDRIELSGGSVRGVTTADGEFIDATTVVSNADPKRTFLELVDRDALAPEFTAAIENIRMDGPSAKVNYVLAAEPRVTGMPAERTPVERSLFTLVPTLDAAERAWGQARAGAVPDELWVDCVLASNVDDTLAPEGRHMLTCFVQYVPYRLRDGDWDTGREPLGDRVDAIIESYAPGFRGSIVARDVVTPLELERRFAITEGNIFHGDIALDQLFFSRPVPGCAHYRTPLKGLYLCGAGTHPGGGVTGAPGHNAAQAVLRDVG